MARHIGRLLGIAAAMTVLAACDPDIGGISDIRDIDGISERGLETNGLALNGFRLNGFRLNGEWLGGSDEQDIKLVKAQFVDGPVILQASLVGSNLHVLTEHGEHLSGSQLAGAELVFDVIEGGLLVPGRRAKIVSAKPLPERPDAWVYDIAVQDENAAWQPLCVDKYNNGTGAFLLTDLWDPVTGDRVSPRPSGAVTIACRGAALAKCVEWGYAPWQVHDGVSLAEAHQACTRAVRADYCGDGTPHTVNGIQIHVKDPLGIQTEDEFVEHVLEAEWGPAGALCLNYENARLPDPDVACDLAPCSDALVDTGMLQTGTLVAP